MGDPVTNWGVWRVQNWGYLDDPETAWGCVGKWLSDPVVHPRCTPASSQELQNRKMLYSIDLRLRNIAVPTCKQLLLLL